MGTLYVVATPIGNLEDITLRALRILGSVGLIVAEDTRTTRKLLTHHALHAPLLSYNEHNTAQRVPRILRVLETGDVALVSEAGVPGVSDPGQALVSAAADRGVPLKLAALDAPEVVRLHERALVLVRPDGHVAWRGDQAPDDPGAMIDVVRGA